MGNKRTLKLKISKTWLFSVTLGLFPLLNSYSAGLPSIDIGIAIVMLLFIVSFPRKLYRTSLNTLILYILFITPVMVLISGKTDTSLTLIILRYLKMLLILMAVFPFGLYQRYFDERIVIKAARVGVYINALFIFIQTIAVLILNLRISNPLLGFAINDAYSIINYQEMRLFRPCGFFLEPAHMTTYCLSFLIYSLYCSDNKRDILITTIAILCTGSGMGIVFLAVHMGLYTLYKTKHNPLKGFAIIAFSVLAILFIMRIPYIQAVIARFTTSNQQGGGNAIVARIGKGYQIFAAQPLYIKIFGQGYGNVPVGYYLNGVTYCLITIGVAGLIIYYAFIIKMLIKHKGWKRYGMITIAILAIGSQIFTPASIAFYFTFFGEKSITQNANL